MKTKSFKIVLFLLIVCSFTSQAQTKEHMEFKGIPITGHIDDFVKKLEGIGFVVEEKEEKVTTLNGNFVNQMCEVYVHASPRTKTVFQVSIYLPEETSWYSIKNSYTDFMEQFFEKYGKPSKNFNFFNSPYEEGDGYEMTAVTKGKCTYSALLEVNGGSIMVKISKYAQINFTYEDGTGILLKNAEENAIIRNDI